ncbi:MAG: T9SS type A sorting domain-containing protein, partial [Bacteroidetes bacterium]|nr:T9SS type A sorting domain-containing protein [Bacteroidota bacterium]
KENGIYTEDIDCSDLNAGLYILKLKIGDSIFTRKINIEK